MVEISEDMRDMLQKLDDMFSKHKLKFEYTADDFKKIWADMRGSPRVIAITIGGVLESTLDLAIRSRLRVLDDGIGGRIFGSSASVGFLSPMANKIDMGYALGIYGKTMRNNLIVIARIRNRFAHLIKARDFDYGDITSLCNKLTLATVLSDVIKKTKKDFEVIEKLKENLFRFLVSSVIIWAFLMHKTLNTPTSEIEDDEVKSWIEKLDNEIAQPSS